MILDHHHRECLPCELRDALKGRFVMLERHHREWMQCAWKTYVCPITEGDLLKAMLDPGQDLMFQGADEHPTALRWYQLIIGDFDLELESACGLSFGIEEPDWWHEEIECDLEYDLKESGSTLLAWAMHNGLVPYQRFLLEIGPPRWFQSGGYEYPAEWDMEKPVTLVKVANEGELWQLEHAIALITAAKRERDQDRKDDAAARWADVSRMYLRRDLYCANGEYSFMSATGKCLMLCTSRHGVDAERLSYHVLASGRSTESWDDAMTKLIEQVDFRDDVCAAIPSMQVRAF